MTAQPLPDDFTITSLKELDAVANRFATVKRITNRADARRDDRIAKIKQADDEKYGALRAECDMLGKQMLDYVESHFDEIFPDTKTHELVHATLSARSTKSLSIEDKDRTVQLLIALELFDLVKKVETPIMNKIAEDPALVERLPGVSLEKTQGLTIQIKPRPQESGTKTARIEIKRTIPDPHAH